MTPEEAMKAPWEPTPKHYYPDGGIEITSMTYEDGKVVVRANVHDDAIMRQLKKIVRDHNGTIEVDKK